MRFLPLEAQDPTEIYEGVSIAIAPAKSLGLLLLRRIHDDNPTAKGSLPLNARLPACWAISCTRLEELSYKSPQKRLIRSLSPGGTPTVVWFPAGAVGL